MRNVYGLFDLISYVNDHQKMKLVAGTPVYKHWQKPDLATTNSLHLFSLVNLEEFMSGREKARLVEMGPYVFQEQIERTNIVHHHHNGSVTYKTKRVWHHRPDLSCGSLQDNVTTINFPVMVSTEYCTVCLGIQYYTTHTNLAL